MRERVLIDNDVVLKVSCYMLVDEMLQATTVNSIAPAMLGVGRYVVRGRLDRARHVNDRARARTAFDRLLASLLIVEPDEQELSMAADMEAAASRQGVELDGGESQLLAILTNRACRLLLTGDKRAITAMSVVAIKELSSRVACLEQLIAHLVVTEGVGTVRSRVCVEAEADRAITLCLGCTMSVPPGDQDVLDGLASYIRHLDRTAPGVLVPGIDLAALRI